VMSRAYDSETLDFFVESSMNQARQFPYKKNVRVVNEIPPWAPDKNSPLIKLVSDAMKANGVTVTSIGAVAGGLETASLVNRYPEVPMISIGPDIFDVHSPAERFTLSSVQKFLAVLDTIVASIGKTISD
jgi:di/tripeptidase